MGGGGGLGGAGAPSVGVLMELVAAVRCPDGRLIVLAYGLGRLRVSFSSPVCQMFLASLMRAVSQVDPATLGFSSCVWLGPVPVRLAMARDLVLASQSCWSSLGLCYMYSWSLALWASPCSQDTQSKPFQALFCLARCLV